MKANNPDVHSMDAVLDKLYGAVGTPERDEFRKEAAAYCARSYPTRGSTRA